MGGFSDLKEKEKKHVYMHTITAIAITAIPNDLWLCSLKVFYGFWWRALLGKYSADAKPLAISQVPLLLLRVYTHS